MAKAHNPEGIRKSKSWNARSLHERKWTPESFHDGWCEAWVNVQGTLVPRMNIPTQRVSFPSGYDEWQDEYYVKLPEERKKLRDLELSAEPLDKAARTKRKKAIKEMYDRIAQIEEDAEKFKTWENTQIHRCVHGYRHMTGPHYFYYNFVFIQEVDENGNGINSIRPDYRALDNLLFRRIEEAQARKDGDLWAKRRRAGATWIAAAISMHGMTFKEANIMFLTYDREDQWKFFDRIMFIYDRLPKFLQKPIKNDNRLFKKFAPSPRICEFTGKDPDMLSDAEITSGSPTEEKSVTGGTSSMVIIDEIGEIENLRQLLSWATPRLAAKDGLTRAGVLLLFGTIGSMDKAGPVVKQLVDSPRMHKHANFLLKGTYGVRIDEYGNDKEEEAEAMIREERAILEDANAWEELTAFKQKYPLEWADCWVYSTVSKLMPVRYVSVARDNMVGSDWNKKRVFGLFYRAADGSVKFKREEPLPSAVRGAFHEDMIGYNQWCIWEGPQESRLKSPYAAGCDPVDMQKDRFGNARNKAKHRMVLSDITASIYKRDPVDPTQIGDFWVAEYQGRPHPLEDAYEQILLACEYYGCKLNLERAKGSAFQAYAEATGRISILSMGVGQAMMIHSNGNLIGYDATERWWDQMLSHMRQWWIRFHGRPVSPRFLYESEYVKEKNTDQFVSHAAAKQLAIELDMREANGQDRMKAVNKAATESSWQRTRRGRYVNITNMVGGSYEERASRTRQIARQRQTGRRRNNRR